MALEGQIQRLSPGAIVDLFTLDLTTILDPTSGLPAQPLYFTPTLGENAREAVFRGITYNPAPIRLTGLETTSRGSPPRPRLAVSNIEGLVSSLLVQYDDITGATLVRVRTFAEYLDGGEIPDPLAQVRRDLWFIERKISESPAQVEFELSSAMDLEGVRLPRRLVFYDACSFVYEGNLLGRGGMECPYTRGGNGDQTNMFDIFNTPVADPALDRCGKRVTSCWMRFGRYARVYFGGFPGTQRTVR